MCLTPGPSKCFTILASHSPIHIHIHESASSSESVKVRKLSQEELGIEPTTFRWSDILLRAVEEQRGREREGWRDRGREIDGASESDRETE